MSNPLLRRIKIESERRPVAERDRDMMTALDGVPVLMGLVNEYTQVEGARDGEYNDTRDNILRKMTQVCFSTFGYHERRNELGLNPTDRAYLYAMGKVALVTEYVFQCESYTTMQEKFDASAFKRLLDGHYDDYLKEDRLPLPFKWMEEKRQS